MPDFPAWLVEFQRQFPDDDACAAWLIDALALWVSMSGMRRRQGLTAWRKALHLRMRRLRQADLGDGRHDHARFEAAFARMVLGRLSHGHPFEWDFGAAIAKSSSGSARTSPRGCCAPSCVAPWSRRAARRSPASSRSTRPRSRCGPGPIRFAAAAARPRAKCWSPAPSKSKTTRSDAFAWPRSRTSSPPTSPQARRSKPTAGRPTPAPPTSGTSPMSSAPWPPMSFCPGSNRAFSNAKT